MTQILDKTLNLANRYVTSPTDFDVRADAISTNKTSTQHLNFAERCKLILIKMALSILAFLLAMSWMETLKDIYKRWCPLQIGTIRFTLVFSVVISIVAFGMAIWYAEIT